MLDPRLAKGIQEVSTMKLWMLGNSTTGELNISDMKVAMVKEFQHKRGSLKCKMQSTSLKLDQTRYILMLIIGATLGLPLGHLMFPTHGVQVFHMDTPTRKRMLGHGSKTASSSILYPLFLKALVDTTTQVNSWWARACFLQTKKQHSLHYGQSRKLLCSFQQTSMTCHIAHRKFWVTQI